MKKSIQHSKQNKIIEELANRRMEEIRDIRKQIDFNNLIYHYGSKNVSNFFIF